MAANGTVMQRKYRGKYDNPRPKSQFQQVKDFLKAELADGKKVHKKDLESKARELGLTVAYFADAKTDLKIIGEKSNERANQATWRLPDEQEPAAYVTAEATIDLQKTHHLCEDEFSVTMEERKRYNIADNEQVCWIRDPRIWKGIEMGDSVRQFKRDNLGGRVVLENGEFVTNGRDVIMAVRAMEGTEALRKKEAQQASEIEKQHAGLRDDDFDKMSDERLRARMHQNSIEHQMAGMIGPGSPSSGMAYEDYVKNRGLTRAQIEAEELQYSLGSTYSREISDEEAEATMAASRRAGGRSGDRDGRGDRSSGKIYSLPPTIRPRNLAAK